LWGILTRFYFGEFRGKEFFNTHGLWVLKNTVKRISFGWEYRHFLRSPQLRGGFPNGCYRLAEEAHQSLDVLGRRCKEELLPNELHPT